MRFDRLTMPLAIMLDHAPWEHRHLINFTSLLSPAAIVPFNEFDNLHEFGEPWAAVLANFAFYAALLLIVRFICLRNADRWLGRPGPKDFFGPEAIRRAPPGHLRPKPRLRN